MKKPKGTGFARRVTLDNLDIFLPLLRKAGPSSQKTSETKRTGATSETDRALDDIRSWFDGESIKYDMPFTRPPSSGIRTRKGTRRKREIRPSLKGAPAAPIRRGPEIWKKILPASDVQRQPGNPTGGVRLTQAGYRVAGQSIDHTRYFKQDLWGHFPWYVKSQNPYVEEASIPFNIKILGNDLGTGPLVISHKPSGEASQRNYTTMLHWGPLGDYVKQANLVGKTLTLFGPTPGSRSPYFIEIL